MSAPTHTRENDLEKLRELVKDIDFCMLTTVDEGGDLHSRPMSSNGDIDTNGDIWFFTKASSHKVSEIANLPKVNVSFADPDNQRYVSVSGTAQLVRDRAKIDELWRPEFKICASLWKKPSTGTAHRARLDTRWVLYRRS